MNTMILFETGRRTLAGLLSFPAGVDALLAEGVESYRVDYVTRMKTWYGAGGDFAAMPIPLEDLPPIPAALDVEALQQNLRDSQARGQVWRDFSRRATAAGVASYTVFLRSGRVIYTGRTGDQHVEAFPALPLSAPRNTP